MTHHWGMKAFVAAVVAGYSIAGATSTAVGQYRGFSGPGGDGGSTPVMDTAFSNAGGNAYSMPDSQVFPSYSDPPGDCGCNGCNECYTPACPRGGWSAGASAYILSPFSSQNTAFLTNTATTVTPTNLAWQYSASPAIWIGHRTAGGIKTRARFFYFDQISNPATALAASVAPATTTISLALPIGPPAIPFVIGTGGASGITASNRLFLNIGDIETGVYEAAAGKYSFQAYAGVRYAYMSSNTNALSLNVNDGITVGNANFFHSFNGGGPTLFGQGYRQIGGSAFAVFGSMRGALLVGSSTQQVNTSAVRSTFGGAVLASTPFSYRNQVTSTLPVAEIETGLEYRLPCRYKMIFARIAAVDMTFFNFGGPLDTTSNLSLFGGRASIGCNY